MDMKKILSQLKNDNRSDKSIMFVAPDLYITCRLLDKDFAEIWVTRDSHQVSYKACIIQRYGRHWLSAIDDEAKEEIMRVANEKLTKDGERIYREGEWFAFDYGKR